MAGAATVSRGVPVAGIAAITTGVRAMVVRVGRAAGTAAILTMTVRAGRVLAAATAIRRLRLLPATPAAPMAVVAPADRADGIAVTAMDSRGSAPGARRAIPVRRPLAIRAVPTGVQAQTAPALPRKAAPRRPRRARYRQQGPNGRVPNAPHPPRVR